MWKNSNSKVFLLEKRRKNPSINLQRVKGQIRLANGIGGDMPVIILVRVLAPDFSEKGVELFSVQDIPIGAEVSLTIDGPQKFFVKGSVIARQELRTDTKIIRDQQYKFRIGIKFSMTTPEEIENAKQYAQVLNGKLHKPNKNEKPANAEAAAAAPAEGASPEGAPPAAEGADAPAPAEGEAAQETQADAPADTPAAEEEPKAA